MVGLGCRVKDRVARVAASCRWYEEPGNEGKRQTAAGQFHKSLANGL